jgi:hypothetical protein
MDNNFIKHQSDFIWQDREIRFDSKIQLLSCRRGEQVIGIILNFKSHN